MNLSLTISVTSVDLVLCSSAPATFSQQSHIIALITAALHSQTNLTLPWPVVDNAIQKCRVCSCFKGENRPSIISFVYAKRPQLILDRCIDRQLAFFGTS